MELENKEKENQMEENQKKEDEGATPTPSQEDASQENFTDNSDFTPDDLAKELENLDDSTINDDDSTQNDASNNGPSNVDENNSLQDAPKPDEALDEKSDTTLNEKSQDSSEKLLTQSQVNELVGKARKEGRESAYKELMSRYGVYNEDELNDIFGRGQAYDDLDYEYQNQGKSYKDAMAENALLKSHIDESRWDDVKLILTGKGLEVNAENISALLPTHPEWNGTHLNNNNTPELLTQDLAEQLVDKEYQNAQVQIGAKKPGVLKRLGNEPTPAPKEKSEEELAAELYGW